MGTDGSNIHESVCLIGLFPCAGNAVSKRLEGLKSKKFPGAAPLDPPGGAYSVPPDPPAAVPSCSAASRPRFRHCLNHKLLKLESYL